MANPSSCTTNGSLDDSKFNSPIPYIGIYVVAASAACAIATALDAFHGFRHKKLWFPCKYFALNATTLTLITVATKLSVDLNTSMPGPHDQLTKLSSTAFLCTAIANSMPSLGTMDNTKELMMNVVALSILVITVLVNVGIQLFTGVIYVFWIEHAVVMIIMVVLLAISISSSLAIPAAKRHLDIKYGKKYKVAQRECSSTSCAIQKMRDDLMRYWMMAHTCNPQFVMGRLATCTASGAFCLVSAFTLIEGLLRFYLKPDSFTFCKGDSDYKWSVPVILVTQTIAVVGGTIAPACKWFLAITFRCPNKKTNNSSKNEFCSIEKYWVEKLHQLKECPLDLRICGRHGRKFVHKTKNRVLDLCIWTQKGIVVLSKLVGLISIFFVSRLMRVFRLFKCKNTIFTESESRGVMSKVDLSEYVLHLEGEKGLIDVMMEFDRDVTGHWIKMGRKKQPRYLVQLLESKLNPLRGFEGVHKFDSPHVPSLDSEEPPNCWALPVVTLTSIAVAINSNTDFQKVKEVIKCVHEGLNYIRVIENSLDVKRDLRNMRKAAEIVWGGVDLHYRWLDVDLREMGKEKNPKDILSELSDIAKHKFMEMKKNDVAGCLGYSASKWPVKVLAANAMYRICQTLLVISDNSRSSECSVVTFERLTNMITDIMAACLTNLQNAISIKCHVSTIEEREENVCGAILFFGKTEKILEILSRQPHPSLDRPEKMACINEWRTFKEPLCCKSSPTTNSDSEVSTSSDLYLNID